MFYLAWAIRRSRNAREAEEPSITLGQVGTVITELAPRGVIRLDDGNWTAESDDGTVIAEGDRVIVVGFDGLILTVIPADEVG